MKNQAHQVTLQQVLAVIPGWSAAEKLEIQATDFGYTNTNYHVNVDDEHFILRISGANTAWLGIDRQAELDALTAAAHTGIGPEVICYLLPEGHMVTRFIEGRRWTVDEYSTPENLRRVVETVKEMHNLPPIRAAYSPFHWVEARARDAQTLGVTLPEDFETVRKQMQAIEATQSQHLLHGFCHNDLFSVNFIAVGERIRILDWEFAGMGDVFLDLATLVYAFDADGPLAPDLQDYILECYFGRIDPIHRQRLQQMQFMILLRDAMWGLVQHGLHTRPGAPAPRFDFMVLVEDHFAQLRQFKI